MVTLQRASENPILIPQADHEWEREGAFNGCVVFAEGKYHMVYRAFSSQKKHNGVDMHLSTVGYAESDDGIHFKNQRFLFGPDHDWELYGCEDPRITYLDGKYYIFYTALSTYPFSASGIKLAVAITKDFQTFEKHQVTTFNSKAMGLFPEKINGKWAALLTMHTDLPPAKIALALFDKEEDIWSSHYWTEWYENANMYPIHLMRDIRDQVELGAPPIKTEKGWLVIYSYIEQYLSDDKKFGIEAVLLDLENPLTILGRTKHPLMVPQEAYEMEGIVPHVIFPSGALVKEGTLLVYYGAADTRCAVATCSLSDLLKEIMPETPPSVKIHSDVKTFERFEGNPIIIPALELEWQALGTYNPAAFYEEGKVHIVYRAQAKNGTSVFGYATSTDGFHIDENLEYPIYTPREDFEKKTKNEGNSGCEDPRITRIDDRYYMTYTAYDGVNAPRVAMTWIRVSDFLERKWNWEKPKLISTPGVDDKDACLIKGKKGSYIGFHRLGNVIWVDFLRDLEFPEKKFLTGGIIAQPRKDKWDNVKVGIAAPPIETERGWVLLYHAVSNPDFKYKVGAMLLDLEDPRRVIARSENPLLEPEKDYEIKGNVANVVFPCGAVVLDGVVYLYYGGADTVIGVATMPLESIVSHLLNS